MVILSHAYLGHLGQYGIVDTYLRRIAISKGLDVTGTVGIIVEAAGKI